MNSSSPALTAIPTDPDLENFHVACARILLITQLVFAMIGCILNIICMALLWRKRRSTPAAPSLLGILYSVNIRRTTFYYYVLTILVRILTFALFILL